MSTKVQSPSDAPAEASTAGSMVANESPVAPATNARAPIWRGRRYQIAVGAVIVVFLAAVVGNSVLARQYTADGAVRQYLTALQSGEAGQAWDVIQISAPTASAAATLTDRTALQAALATAKAPER